tara:strand:+ start:1242 stop:1910 length:669 start_codon:yes stop_codon:yes gene_type:complete
MKVGTDGVLLGAWCSLKTSPNKILDIGSGTGLIALMMAQRSNAMTIDAVEIDGNAYEQTIENFEKSDWRDRLFCYHSSFQDFVFELKEDDEKYDLIVSNPPFYTDAFQTNDSARNKARFLSALPFQKLLSGAADLLSSSGRLAVIIPCKEEINFISIASKFQLFLVRICRVKGSHTSDEKRSLLEFSFKEKKIEKQTLVIETSRHQYTKQYIDLVKDFYLKM